MLAAVVLDFRRGKVSNALVFGGMSYGLARHLMEGGLYGLGQALAGLVVPCALLYGLFRIGALGAGDVKLLGAAGAVLGFEDGLCCLVFSFLSGALLSLAQMCRYRVCRMRLRRLSGYLRGVLAGDGIRMYGDDGSPGGRIHFSLAILAGVLVTIGKGALWR